MAGVGQAGVFHLFSSPPPPLSLLSHRFALLGEGGLEGAGALWELAFPLCVAFCSTNGGAPPCTRKERGKKRRMGAGASCGLRAFKKEGKQLRLYSLDAGFGPRASSWQGGFLDPMQGP